MLGVGLDAQDALVFRVDGKDSAAERGADQVPEDGAGHAALALGRADDGHALRLEHHLQRVLLHAQHVVRGAAGHIYIISHGSIPEIERRKDFAVLRSVEAAEFKQDVEQLAQ